MGKNIDVMPLSFSPFIEPSHPLIDEFIQFRNVVDKFQSSKIVKGLVGMWLNWYFFDGSQ